MGISRLLLILMTPLAASPMLMVIHFVAIQQPTIEFGHRVQTRGGIIQF